MASSDRPLSPHLQIYRLQLHSILSALHRLSGLLLALASLLLVYWLFALAAGPDSYQQAQNFFAHGLTLAFLVLVSLAFFLHLCNGVRHLFWDLGWGFEIPQVRASGWATVVAALVLTGGFWMFSGAV